MRWLVSVTSLGKTESEPLQIEADTWQGALQVARVGRGDGESLGSLTIEVSDAGCRAVDASSLLRYEVRPLGNDAGAPSPDASPAGAPVPLGRPSNMLPPRPSGSVSKRPSGTPPPPTGPSQPPPTAASQPPQAEPAPAPPDVIILKSQVIEAGPPSAPPPSSRPSRPDSSGIPLQVVFKREEERTPAKPLTYREYVYVVPANTSDQDAHTLLYHQLELVRSSLDRLPAGKLVNLAVFDAQFQGKPQGAPLATLTWKDWRPDAIVYTPRHAGSANGVGGPRAATSEPPVAEPMLAQAAAPRDIPLTEKSPDRRLTPVPDPFAPFAPPANAGPPVQPSPSAWPGPPGPLHGSMAPAPDTKLSVQRRVRGDELVADLFDVMHDLHFLRDALEGGDFCLAVAMEKLPAEAGWVHLYDIDRREFVVTSVRGGSASVLVLRRHSEREKLLAEAMRGRKPVVIADATDAAAPDIAIAERFALVGGARSIIVAPVMQAGRFLGAIELVNPLDGLPFTETDGAAVAYIADQFAEFVAARGVVTDEERIAARRPRA
jgi:hypothetical protein